MWHMSDGWGWWIIIGAAWWLIIWATVALVGTRIFGGSSRDRKSVSEDPIRIAERRFAAGTITAAQLSEIRAELAKAPFIAYPTDYLFGVIDAPAEARAAVSDLHRAGIADDEVSLSSGEEGALRIDASGARHGILGRFVRLLQAMSMNAEHATSYEAEAREGHQVVAIHLHSAQDRETARGILERHGGHFINYYARMHFETLVA